MQIENETHYDEEEGYYLDIYKDGALLTFMTFGEDDKEEGEEAVQVGFFEDAAPVPIIRASIFICKPEPEIEEEEDI